MKRIYRLLAVAMTASVLFTACSEDTQDPVMKSQAEITAPVLASSLSATNLTFTKETNDNNLVISWSKTDAGVALPVTYKILLDKKGGDFKSAEILAEKLTDTKASITYKTLNRIMLVMSIPAAKATDFDIKVVATYTDMPSIKAIESKVVSVKFTAWNDPTAFPSKLFLAGSFQGWKNDNEATVLKAIEGTVGQLQGVYLFSNNDDITKATNGGEFKILVKKGDWGSQWGEMGTPNGILDPKVTDDPSNIAVPNAGYNKIWTDWSKKTYTITPVSWGVIGEATTGSHSDGWNQDIDMTFVAPEKAYTLDVALKGGEWKVRFNDGWDLNLGKDGKKGGDNIKVDAGTYRIKVKYKDAMPLDPYAYEGAYELTYQKL